MPLPITVYGATDCDDTERTRQHLRTPGVPFQEIDIDHLVEAERFVIFIHDGCRSTPTLVLGAGKHKSILAEPTNVDLEATLAQASHTVLSTVK